MRTVEESAFARGITAENLMEQAGAGIARAIRKFFPHPGQCLVFAGKGHNAGDAFVAARWLAEAGWKIETRLVFPEKELSPLTSQKLNALRAQECGRGLCAPIAAIPGVGAQRPLPHCPTIILDGLLGLGAHPPLREPIRAACREINSLGQIGAPVFAVDLPSGLDGDSGEADPDCVVADFTITVGCAKSGLVADAAIDFVGRLEVVVLDELRRDELLSEPSALQSQRPLVQELAIPESLRGLMPRRNFSSYKNQFGRIGIVAGSRGFTGAAVMCSLGALRAGAGLVELFVPEEIYEAIACAAAPEVMVKPVSSYAKLLEEPIDVWAVGPGLGKSRAHEIIDLIRSAKAPMVIDADALNILSEKIETLEKPAGPRLLTPHPGEMKRLFPQEKGTRAEIAGNFTDAYRVTLLLKGSRTIVAEAGRPLCYNTTGNPGMATGGMGDVLTGVCAGLLGAKLLPNDAARLGAWLCGRAAELAISGGAASEESLLPTDVLDHLGPAFRELRGPS